MSDLEYDVLDELYFVQSYFELKEKLLWDDETLRPVLQGLQRKGWIKCYLLPDDEEEVRETDIETRYRSYYYIASKGGLFAHNSFNDNV